MTASAAVQPRRQILEGIVQRGWPVSLGFVAVLVIAWELSGVLGALPSYILAPSSILAGVWDLHQGDILWGLLGPSLRRAMIGFAIGTGLGVVLGLVAGTVRVVEDLIDLPMSFTYPLPKIALFPVFAVWLGFRDPTRILVIALACFYPAYLNAFSGTRGINPRFIWVARNVGARRIRTFLQVVFPAALPRTFAGIQISLAISFILLFATETIGFSDGLGSDIFRSFQNGLYQRMYAGIAVLGFAGFLANALLVAVTRRLSHGDFHGKPTRV